MAIVNMQSLLNYAYQQNFSVVAFDIPNLDILETCIHSAEQCNAPLILHITESELSAFQFDSLLSAAEHAAISTRIPTAIHLNNGSSLDSAIHAINSGCNGIMVNNAYKQLTDNIESTLEIVKTARNCGIAVEGNLALSADIKLDQWKTYSQDTKVDFVYLSTDQYVDSSNLDIQTIYAEQIKAIRQTISQPLSIRADKGLTKTWYREISQYGVAKIAFDLSNIQPFSENSNRSFLNIDKNQLQNTLTDIFLTLNSTNKGKEILNNCSTWRPVEHLIIYNVANISENETRDMMLKGQELLSTIPGVRRVEIGQSVLSDAKYQFTWLVRFCHPDVIESYRHHPIHVAFADELFRPVAADRISIDYEIL